MSIQNLLLGSLVNTGADRLLNPNRRNVVDINKLTGGGYFGTIEDEDNKDKGPTTLGGIAKTGIMKALGFQLANAILGPIFGPLALNLATRFVDRRKQGLGFFEQPGDLTTQPEDVRGTFTAEGTQFANIQDSLGSTDPNKDINYNTGVITDKTTGKAIGNVYDEVALIKDPPAYDFDDSSSDSGGSDSYDGASSMEEYSADPTSFSGSFRYGGLASLYR